MLQRVDSAVIGEVQSKTTWSGPTDGTPATHEFTTIVVAGDDLVTGKTATRSITYYGSDAEPNSEMPSEIETRVGARGIFFSEAVKSSWGGRDNLNSLTAAHAGVFPLETGPKGDVIIGKGAGSAVEKNIFVKDLREQVSTILADIRRGK